VFRRKFDLCISGLRRRASGGMKKRTAAGNWLPRRERLM
jgi:hypothetical protein